jgi:hypothetical protein
MPAPASPTPPTTLTPHPTLPGVLGDRLKVKVAAPA